MEKLIDSRWFALADLACASFASILWVLEPRLGWPLLGIALAPWILRLVSGRFPFRRTPLDLPIGLFLATAGLGVWTAYNQEAAWAKLWSLVGAVFLFYAFAGQPQKNIWLLAGFLALIGAAVSTHFLLTNNWNVQPAKLYLINHIGLWWMNIRPPILGSAHPLDDSAGLAFMMAPFLAAIFLHAWHEKRVIVCIAAGVSGLLSLAALALAPSRGAWLALVLIFWAGLGWLVARYLFHTYHFSPRVFFSLYILLTGAAGIGMAFLLPGQITTLGSNLQGSPQAPGLLEMASRSVNLVGDFPFTGGGLSSFPGLYARYELMTPNFIIPHSQNVFLDVAIQQGGIGFLAFLWILVGSAWLLSTSKGKDENPLIFWATLAGLLILATYGLVDNIAYSTPSSLLLLIIPGMAMAVASPPLQNLSHLLKGTRLRGAIFGTLAILLVGLGLASFFLRPLQAAWFADIGALEMARVELADFPTGSWYESQNPDQLALAERLFQQALQANPNNRTANYRLGLIELKRRNFSQAIQHLEIAHRLDPSHHGVQKVLGYSYAWSGEIDQALLLLAKFPEVRTELYNYPLWWRNQGRQDLASYADQIYSQIPTLDE